MCGRCVVVVFFVLVLGMVGMSGPVAGGARSKQVHVVPKLSPENFRCILVGDSQTTGPNSNRIRTQFHRWDAPIVGELITVGNSSTGYLVNNSNGGIANLTYSNVFLNSGWPGGGPDDFFAPLGSGWVCGGDIAASGSRVGRYRLRFGGNNVDAPWSVPWGINNLLVAKIAVRTSPMCVDAVQTRAERGGVTSGSARTVHKLKKTWGVQIIEQIIPVDFNPMGDDVGVGLYFPTGSIEQAGQVLQILGVVIERVDSFGRLLPGTIVGYQGRGGWGIEDHLDKISLASRVALIEMIDADAIMMVLGHNRESAGESALAGSMAQLVADWETAFTVIGRRRPAIIYVAPWAIVDDSASSYMLEVESVMQTMAENNRRDVFVNYLPRYNYLRPDVYDPARYQLDAAGVHPGGIPTAVNLSEDLYQLLFFSNRLQK